MIYARIENGMVVEIIQPMFFDDGSEIPIELRFTPQFVATLINVSDENPMPDVWWRFDGERFLAPSAQVVGDD
ncbi:hypothetical protein [Achromobacter sp. UBA2119]|uniref:hypothetical protein n=1 Tax=Achromobacter sp. UBA2119 TaxID=1945911 RepID=UPI002580D71C|nr:hypothetical protein [Achromobacter sp. UBA2119]